MMHYALIVRWEHRPVAKSRNQIRKLSTSDYAEACERANDYSKLPGVGDVYVTRVQEAHEGIWRKGIRR